MPSRAAALTGMLGVITLVGVAAVAADRAAPALPAVTTGTTVEVERVTTVAPYPRGLAVVDDAMYVLCRGRVRGSREAAPGTGGVTAGVDDQAGTIYAIDPAIGEPVDAPVVSARVRENGRVFARPTDPPFRLWDRAADPPESDRNTDRPYCVLRFDSASDSFYLCAFSGIDKPTSPGDRMRFSKNQTDAVLRYDRRTERWHEIERHTPGAAYPHAGADETPPPHGWLEGPDNCLVLGDGLYVAAKDNSRLVRYDLTAIRADPEAGPPPGEIVLGDAIEIAGHGERSYTGHSALAAHGDWLYVGYRTSSVIVRVPLDANRRIRRPIVGELVARFDPYDPATGRSANITDMTFDDAGRLHVVSAQPARVYRFTPDPARVYDARDDREASWADLAALTGNPAMKSENVLVHDGWLYVTSGDGYAYQSGAEGTVYRVRDVR